MIPHTSFLDPLKLSPDQYKAVVARQGDVVVTAGAGTGKTRTLVARYLSLLAELKLRHIVAITFTDKAAREMRNRVRQELDTLLTQLPLDDPSREQWQTHLAALDAARISTIHSLCGEILRTHPAEAALDPRFTVLNEGDTLLLKGQAITRTLAGAARLEAMTPLFTLWGETGLAELLLALLNSPDASQSALAHLPTRAVEIMSLWQTHLEQAQTERVERLLHQADWQQSVRCLRQEQASRADDKLEGMRRQVLTALESMGTTVNQQRQHLHVLNEINLGVGSVKNWPGGKEQIGVVKAALRGLRESWRAAASVIDLALNEQDRLLAEMNPLFRELFAAANSHYQTSKSERLALDFDDLESKALHLLETQLSVRQYWQTQVGALLVDEFQDTNARQLRLIRHLCPEPAKLFIVGDAKQSIYRFRGADVAVFQVERDHIARARGTVCDLDESYRTHQGLLTTMNDLLRPILGEPGPDRPVWEAPFAPLRHTRTEPAAGIVAPFLELHLGVGTKGDGALSRSAQMVAARLRQLVETKTLAYGDMVILCRASGSFADYENALDEAGIPYVTVAGQGFYQRPEIRDLLNALQALADPSNNLALAGLLRSPLCGLSDVALYELAQAGTPWQSWWARLQQGVAFSRPQDTTRAPRAIRLISQWHTQAGHQTVADVLQNMVAETGYLAGLFQTGQQRAARNVQKLLTTAQQSERIRIEEFLAYLGNVRESGGREGEARTTAEGVVQIMSVHQAKGLEFPLVVLGDAGYGAKGGRDTLLLDEKLGLLLKLQDDEGQKPAMFSLAEAQEKALAEAEEKRLLYVAVTRAEQMVLVSGVIGINPEGKPTASGWLKTIGQVAGWQDLTWPVINPSGTTVHEMSLQVGTSPVRLVVGEGQRITGDDATYDEPVAVVAPFVVPELLAPLRFAAAVSDEHPKEAEQPQRVWQVVPTAQKPTAPAWVVGSLVHTALALWRFPGADFALWCEARAREYGLTDHAQLRDAERKTRQLLDRFRQYPLYAEMNQAERRLAELPYVVTRNGQVERGIIDALYLYEGQWTIVDYKTDEVADEAELIALLATKDYRQQLSRYALAVEQLVGLRPRLLLCFLQVGTQIHLVPV